MWLSYAWECGELPFGRFPLNPKEADYKSNVWQAIPYENEAWCLKESNIGQRFLMRAVCCRHIKDSNGPQVLMLSFFLYETMDQLAMANNICWYGDVLRMKDGHILRRALDFEVEGKWKKLEAKGDMEKAV